MSELLKLHRNRLMDPVTPGGIFKKHGYTVSSIQNQIFVLNILT